MDTIDHIDLRMLRLFHSVGHSGSFSDAGRQFEMPRAVVSRLIAQLEAQLGVRLFQRTTRKVALTEEGEALLRQLTPSLEGVRHSLLKAQAKTDAIGGTVILSVAHAFGRHYVLPALAAFRDAYPDISVEVRMAEGIDSVIDSNIDLVIRQGTLPDSSIVARRLGELPVILAAPKSLLAGSTSALTLDTITRLPCIGFRIPGAGSLYQWAFEKQGERTLVTPPRHVMITDSIESVADLVCKGHGIAPVPLYLVESHIADGTVNAVLAGHNIAGISVHLCFGSRALMPKRVRLLADHLLRSIGPLLR
jgi:DNA-binding transcriptional LysR family regulator